MKIDVPVKYFKLIILLLLAIMILLSIVGLFQVPQALGYEKMMKHIMKDIGGNARIIVFLAIGYWISKKGIQIMSKKKLPFIPIVRNLTVALKNHHVLLGFTALILALIHGIYFLLVFLNIKQEDLFTNITGIISIILLFLLVIFGWILRQKKKGISRKRHFQFSILFFVFFLIHWLFA